MQRFERMAAEREREAAARRAAQDDHHDGERPPEEFLNETAYDRRKQVTLFCAHDNAEDHEMRSRLSADSGNGHVQMAVYKRDGTRAHHLTDCALIIHPPHIL